jgi:hypothetical protein
MSTPHSAPAFDGENRDRPLCPRGNGMCGAFAGGCDALGQRGQSRFSRGGWLLQDSSSMLRDLRR